MDPKPRPNHALYIKILRQMSPEKQLLKAFELSEFARTLFTQGLRQKFPHLSEEDFRKKLFEHIDRCRNQNY